MIDNQIMSAVLDVGEAMLTSGGEVSRIEQMMTRRCKAYGAERVDAFSITSSMIVTVKLPGGEVLTQTRRIREWSIDFERLEKLNNLAEKVSKRPMTPEKIHECLEAIFEKPAYETAFTCLGAILAAGGFAVFFGGTWRDGLAASILAFLFTLIDKNVSHSRMNRIAYCFLLSFISGMIAIFSVKSGIGENLDKIMIGGIMLIIPGVALTNSVRDLLLGDVITGLLRLCESLLVAASVAAGFAVALLIGRGWLLW